MFLRSGVFLVKQTLHKKKRGEKKRVAKWRFSECLECSANARGSARARLDEKKRRLNHARARRHNFPLSRFDVWPIDRSQSIMGDRARADYRVFSFLFL